MRKLLSIGIILALLVTFIVPVVVAAQDECCEYTPPACDVQLPDRVTKTLAGAAVWTMLGTADIMGKAVCATTSQMVCNLGGWSDELGVIGVQVTASALTGIGDLIPALLSAFGLTAYADLGTQLANFLKSIAEVLAGAAE